MTRPRAVVLIEDKDEGARREGTWAVQWLKRDFDVAGVRDWGEMERRIDDAVRIALVVAAQVPEHPVPTLGMLRPKLRLLLVVPGEARNEMLAAGFPLDAAGWIELDTVREVLPQQVSAALVHSLFARCRSALGRFEPAVGQAQLLEMMKVALAPPPAKPFHSVNELATVTQRSRRWLNLNWSLMAESTGVPHPDLKDLVRGIVLYRALWLWLSGAPMEVCASALETRVEHIEDLSVQFLGDKPADFDLDALPARLMRLERALFGWLFREPLREAASGEG